MQKRKVILVTGASSKLGQTIISDLSAYFTVVSDRFDVTSDVECAKALKGIVKKYKRLDVVINIAGVTTSGNAENETASAFEKLLQVNAIAHLRINNLATSQMKEQVGGGRIINITSLSGLVPLPGFGVYGASKSAAEFLGLSQHYELALSGVKVTNIAPGAIDFHDKDGGAVSHKTAREKFPLLKYLLPMTTPDKISHCILELIKSDKNPARIIVGVDAIVIFNIFRFLPLSVFEKIVLLIWQKK